MATRFLIIFLGLFLLCSSPCLSKENTATLYRVVFSSPHDFVSALRQVPRSNKEQAALTSRLQQYFKIKRKVVRAKEVEMDLAVDIPLLKEYFDDLTTVHVKLIDLLQQPNLYKFKVITYFKKDQKSESILTVSPHTQGSLLKIELVKSAHSDWLIKAFREFAIKIGFATDKPAK